MHYNMTHGSDATLTPLGPSKKTNQSSLFRSRDWLSANQGLVFPGSVGFCKKGYDVTLTPLGDEGRTSRDPSLECTVSNLVPTGSLADWCTEGGVC